MKFVEVADVPCKVDKPRRKKGELKLWLDSFMSQDIKTARVDFNPDEYIAMIGAYNAMRRACVRHVLPVDVIMRNGDVYLIRRDL